MRPIDADRLEENHPMAGYFGYKQEDIDAEPTLDVVPGQIIRLLGDDLRLFRDTIKSRQVLLGYNMAVALCNKWLGQIDKGVDDGSDKNI